MGAASRAKGISFERRIARRFRDAGFECRRILEYANGQGVDLEVGIKLRFFSDDHPVSTVWLPVALQCKCSARSYDLSAGLAQARAGRPNAELWCCIHSFNRELRIVACGRDDLEEFLTWPELVNKIKALSPIKS